MFWLINGGYILGVAVFGCLHSLLWRKFNMDTCLIDKAERYLLIGFASMAWPIAIWIYLMIGIAMIGIRAAEYLQGNKEES